MEKDFTQDTLTETIGILTRREVEARILIPLIDALGEKFGREEVEQVISETIIDIARKQGQELAESMGGNSSTHFKDSLIYWTKNNALEMQITQHDAETLSYDVTRCQYAEMYKAMGAAGLGKIFSCNRDFALVEGFNPEARLVRDKTIMKGDDVCEFRYTFPSKKEK